MQHRFVWGAVAVGAVFALGVVTGQYYRRVDSGPALETIADDSTGNEPGHVHAHTTYVCPMHAQVVSDKPGTCPICGMALVAAKHAGSGENTNSATGNDTAGAGDGRPVVHVDAAMMNNLGVKVTPVIRTTLMRRIEVPGFVQQIQPGKTARVLAPFDARIVALPAASGQWLEKGQPLVVLESDRLREAEQAHLDLLARAASAVEQTPADQETGSAEGPDDGDLEEIVDERPGVHADRPSLFRPSSRPAHRAHASCP